MENKEEKEELKKCPFCGGYPVIIRTRSQKKQASYIFIKCKVCGAQAKTFRYKGSPEDLGAYETEEACLEYAANAWNTRTNEGRSANE